MKKPTIILVFILVQIISNAQRIDSVMATGGISGDTSWIITENRLTRYKFFGNSWQVGLTYNLAYHSEFAAHIGRTYGKSFCGGGGCYFSMKSWGIGYSLSGNLKDVPHQALHVFAEWSAFPLPPAGIRAEYIFDVNAQQHYLRPSIGLSFLSFDIFYNYSFMLNGTTNTYRHGAAFRLKFYLFPKNWENSYPRHC